MLVVGKVIRLVVFNPKSYLVDHYFFIHETSNSGEGTL